MYENQWGLLEMTFKGIVTQEFIDRRDAIVAKRKAGRDKHVPIKDLIRRWDSEFPEHHQVSIDPKQTLYEGWKIDVIHEVFKRTDYKLYAKAGVHVSNEIQKVAIAGEVDTFAIWTWTRGYKPLVAGMEVEYDILGHVNAQEAVKKIKNNRFPFPLEDQGEFEFEKAMKEIHGTRMDQNWEFFRK